MAALNITYSDATVIHSNKYNQNIGFIISRFIFSNFLQDVVFKIDSTGDEYATTFENLNLQVYPGQKVTLIAVNDIVVAYIDRTSEKFHYLTKNLQRDLKYGLRINWILVIIITILLCAFLAAKLGSNSHYSSIALALPASLWIYQRVINYRLEREIDSSIENS